MTVRKLLQEEVDMNVSQLQECSCGTIHGTFVGDVSPIKTSRKRANIKYFDGWISNGKASQDDIFYAKAARRCRENS